MSFFNSQAFNNWTDITEIYLFEEKKTMETIEEQVNFQWDDDELCFVLDQHTLFDFYSASSLKQQSVDRHVTTLRKPQRESNLSVDRHWLHI
jgi:hypothetical protein